MHKSHTYLDAVSSLQVIANASDQERSVSSNPGNHHYLYYRTGPHATRWMHTLMTREN